MFFKSKNYFFSYFFILIFLNILKLLLSNAFFLNTGGADWSSEEQEGRKSLVPEVCVVEADAEDEEEEEEEEDDEVRDVKILQSWKYGV